MGSDALVKQSDMKSMSIIIVMIWLFWLIAAVVLGTNPLLSLTAFLALCGYIIFLARSKTDTTSDPKPNHDLPVVNVPPFKLTNTLKHDLRAPISLIIGFCDAIFRAARNGELSPSLMIESTETIKRNAQQLETLIAGLSAQSVQTPDMQQEQIDPATLIRETVALIHDLMESRNVNLKIDIPEPLPMLSFNRMMLRQILLNLLRGIGQLMTKDTITLQAVMQGNSFVVSLTASASRIQYVISDSTWEATQRLVTMQQGRLWIENDTSTIYLSFPVGGQMPAYNVSASAKAKPAIVVVTDAAEVIDLFRQHVRQYEVIGTSDIEALRTLSVQPVGVILAQAPDKQAIEKIRALFGSQTPVVVCPILSPHQQIQELEATFLTKPVDYDLLSEALLATNRPIHNVLIVDDSPDTTTMLARMLVSMPAKYATQSAHIAYDALGILHDNLSTIDALILDVSLPDMDGISLVRQLRADSKTAQLPIIIISAHHTLEFMLPETLSASISIVQPTDKFPTTIEAIFNSSRASG